MRNLIESQYRDESNLPEWIEAICCAERAYQSALTISFKNSYTGIIMKQWYCCQHCGRKYYILLKDTQEIRNQK